MPAVNGLYTAILPSATYLFFGSSMQLAVGPVAVVSLMMGSLMSKHQPDYATNPLGAIDTAAQASFNVGILMTVMGKSTHAARPWAPTWPFWPPPCLNHPVARPRIRTVSTGILNLGNFINFISHPVMSGFTTGAAMSIGLSQVNNAFGFNGKTMYV
jgi:MFS superfamily sulfate permease-like transporter